ncbi:DNA polymerase III subunit chi [Albirhodobacter sp. R86504]|uniref:DNA polymerase III subunit chi n=1 Tax=Albirhodobacter sp. R86504 TaxID=3093848 RepID=UPI00366E5A63
MHGADVSGQDAGRGAGADHTAPALFYHLTRSPREQVAMMLLTRALSHGWRVELRANPQTGPLAQLDARLWQGAAGDFLPHGIEGGPHDAYQPVLITQSASTAGAFDAVMTVGGAEVSAADCAGRQRLWILFDGTDEAALTVARGQWKALTAAGVEGQYWSEAEGPWKRMK